MSDFDPGARRSRPAASSRWASRLGAALLVAAFGLQAAGPTLALAQFSNLLQNGSFENGYYHQDGIPELAVPLNWRVYYVDNGTFPGILPGATAYRPETVVWNKAQAPDAERGLFWRDGDYTLKIFKPWGALYSALSQNVGGLQPGATYTLSAYVYVDVVTGYNGATKVPPPNDSEHNDDVLLRLGAGPVGAAWRDASTIRYSPWVTAANRVPFHQSSVLLTQAFQATGSQMSVWIELMSVAPYANNGFFVDNVSLTGPGGSSGGVPAPSAPAASAAPVNTSTLKSPYEVALVGATTYKVVAGDSVAKIAKKFGVPSLAIVILNNLADPRYIRVGQVLIIPNPDKFYTVQRGDSLSVIAQKLGTTVDQLRALNRLPGTLIYTGQILVVP